MGVFPDVAAVLAQMGRNAQRLRIPQFITIRAVGSTVLLPPGTSGGHEQRAVAQFGDGRVATRQYDRSTGSTLWLGIACYVPVRSVQRGTHGGR